MNMHNQELLRQHNDYKAIQARLWGKREPPPAPLQKVIAERRKPVDASYHVKLYYAHLARLRETFTMAASFTVNPTAEYCPYTSEIVFQTYETPMPRRSMKQIALEVLEDFPGVTLDDLRGPRRNLMFVVPRHRAMYEIMRERPDFSYPMVGKFFGRDHTVVLWAVAKIKAEMGDDASIARVKAKKARTEMYQSRRAA